MNEETWRKELIVRPVGVVRSAIEAPAGRDSDPSRTMEQKVEAIRKRMRETAEMVCALEIDQTMAGMLDGIEEFSHIVVLYWPHLIPEERRMFVHVHPMGVTEFPETGIFATRSPARPNPVLVSTVELLERKGNILKVKGLEAVDGSPIVDIKPYTEIKTAIRAPRFAEWLRQVL
jgi:tRNA-Thr(GGU) m(6)t(6)A37 methyltransferase TsaA